MSKTRTGGVAVVGIACWYPGAKSPRELWENVLARRRQFREIPDVRLPLSDYYDPEPSAPDKTYGRLAAVIDGFEFDWSTRRIPKSTFESADIVHWLALEVALQAIGDAGYTRETIPGARTGVIVGNSLTGEHTRSNTLRTRWPFVRKALRASLSARGLSQARIADIESWVEAYYKSVFPPVGSDSLAGGLSNTIAGRICNFLDLRGGGYTVDGACSSSLLAVATAANGLTHGDLDLALAGGVDISLDTFELVGFSKTMALTRTDMTVYDRRGSGFIPGEGCGFVVLKRQEDAEQDGDHIYAVLRGWGVSSDGGGTGLTAPSPSGQAEALRRAYQRAGYSMSTLSFVEGHGTGTRAGDKAELEGVALAIGNAPDAPDRFCGITSLKSVIGHAKAAAGIGGFIKTVIAVNRRVVPPTANCKTPHPAFDDAARKLYPVLQGSIQDPTSVIRAGVSAMGFGGINAHATLESGGTPSERLEPSIEERALMVSHQDTELFTLAGDDPEELTRAAEHLRELSRGIAFGEMTDLAAYSNRLSTTGAPYRCAIVASKPEDLEERIDSLGNLLEDSGVAEGAIIHDKSRRIWVGRGAPTTRIGFLFPGQGSQKLGMARVLVERYPWARDMVAEADRCAGEMGAEPPSSLIYRPVDRAQDPAELDRWFRTLSQTENAQPAICLASALWYVHLDHLGIRPAAVGGHSLGELTAFYAAGAFDFSTLIRLAALRGKAMAAPGERAGTMVSLFCSLDQAEQIVDQVSGYVVVANINGPKQTVLSGEPDGINEAVAIAGRTGIQTRRLKVSNAFHSRLMNTAAEVLANEQTLPDDFARLKTRLFTSLDGSEVKPGLSLRTHFSNQVLARVDFVSLAGTFMGTTDVILEAGPGRVLSGMFGAIAGDEGPTCLPVESTPENDQDFNTAMAALFARGVPVSWDAMYERRLVRKFVPADQRLFIENPCERPFQVSGEVETQRQRAAASSLLDLVPEGLDLSPEDLEAYLNARGAFLADVIRADIKHLGERGPVPKVSGEILERESPPQLAPPIAEESAEVIERSPTVLTRGDIESIIADEIEALTGFSKDSFDMEARLLDGLNMDSLRTGEFVSNVSRHLGLEGADSFAFINNTLSEAAGKFEAMLREQHPERLGGEGAAAMQPEEEPPAVLGQDEVIAIVMEEASRVTGYPLETLDASAIVEKDLGLGKDLLKQLLDACGSRLGADFPVDLEPLAQRSLSQVASILSRMMTARSPGIPARKVQPPTWVREYEPELVVEPRSPLPEWWGQRQEDDWRMSRVLLLCADNASDHGEALQNALLRRGAQVQLVPFDDPRVQDLTRDASFSHLMAVLPQARENGATPDGLRDSVARLATIASPPPASEAPRRRTTIASVQFGGGYFGTRAEFAHLNRVGAQALAASIHLERSDLRVRVIDLSPTLDPERAVQVVLDEINTPAPYAAVGYDYELTRRVLKPTLLQPREYTSRPVQLEKGDVVVVTGGGRGITAACALGLARATGARMVLLGRSPHPDDAPNRESSQEILQTLEQFRVHGLEASYYACDVQDGQAVQETVARIRGELGPIAGVVHGAGLNSPRPVGRVSVDEAVAEVGPKVVGVMHLMAAVDGEPLKLFAGLTSIIGVTGMPGNAWYGYSNEMLDILLRRFGASHQDTATVSVAFSLWRETGLGVRLGSVDKLGAMGIEAIDTREGVSRFVRLCQQDPGCHQVVVTAQVGGLDTWKLDFPEAPDHARYLETLVRTTPGVDAIFLAHLTLESDPYLKDHYFEGAYLLPTVFGLEAMAQAAAYVSGHWDPDYVVLQDVVLRRPIIIDPTSGTDVLVRAEVLEADSEGMTTIRAGVAAANGTESEEAFSASIILDPPLSSDRISLKHPEKPLPVVPVLDLYRKNLLFQGPLFQRLGNIWSLDADGDVGNSAVFDVHRLSNEQVARLAFPHHAARLQLGDPFFRDALLQAALILVPKQNSLPSRVDRWEIYPCEATAYPLTTLGRIELEGIEGREIRTAVVASDPEHRLIERLQGYGLSILRPREGGAGADDLVAPAERDTAIVARTWRSVCSALHLDAPAIVLRYLEDLHQFPPAQRHEIERPFMTQVVSLAAERMGASGEPFEIAWQRDGKPVVRGLERINMHVSLSHDDRLCLFVAGPFAQGCDVTPIRARTREDWSGILGGRHQTTLDALLDRGDDLDTAGARIWACLEVLKKLGRDPASPLTLAQVSGEAVLLAQAGQQGEALVLTLPVHLTWGPPRVLATAVEEEAEITTEFSLAAKEAYEPLTSPRAELLEDAGPQGQPVMMERFHVTFKPCAELSRHLHYTTLLFWAGEVREMSAWPVHAQLTRDLATGEVGLVTNWAVIRFYGEAVTHDVVEARMWTIQNGGPKNSTMDLAFDFRKCLPDGSQQRIAWMEQQTTWVRVLEHGMVEPDEYPDYYWQLMKDMMPKWEGENERDPLPEPLADVIAQVEADPILVQTPDGAHTFPVLYEHRVETSQGHANFVGNIYFAHYHAWMGEARDRFFYQVMPQRFRGVGKMGEILITECRVNHLREAMPFDVVLIAAGVKTLRPSSVRMVFEFFRVEPDGTKTYLAHGSQDLVWVVRDEHGNPVPQVWPDEVLKALRAES